MATMTALSTVTVGAGGASSISFTSIPQTYTDLIVKFSLRHSNSQSTIRVTFNSNTSTNYKWIRLLGDGSSVVGDNQSTYGAGYNTALFAQVTSGVMTANGFGNGEIYIPNYVLSNNKSSLVDSVSANNSTSAPLAMLAGLLENTSAVTSIEFAPESAGGTFAQYSTVTVYGVFSGPETLPSTPTIGTATVTSGTTATVAFTPTSATGVDASYTALSTPGSITATGASSPITVSGLTTGTAYTFQVRANNPGGSSAYSSASNSVTPEILGAFESIATANPSGTSSVTFSSIPQTYKHLQIRITARSTVASNQQEIAFTINGDTGNNYGRHILYGDGSSVNVDGRAASDPANYLPWIMGNNASANMFGVMILDILDYTDTNKTRTTAGISGTDRNGGGFAAILSGHYSGTSAVSSITLTNFGGSNYVVGSKIALYGIKGS